MSYCFEVVTPSRVYYFSAEDDEKKTEWKEAFSRAVYFNKIDWDPVAVASELSTEVVSTSKHTESDEIVQRFTQKIPIPTQEKLYQVGDQEISSKHIWKMTLETLLDNIDRHSKSRDFVLECLQVASQSLLDLNPSNKKTLFFCLISKLHIR